MIIGITGGFGTGKTTVARMFAAKGAVVLDADRLSRRALSRGTAPYKKIVKAFGVSILKRDGSIDRRRLAAIVFTDKRALKKLTDIVHPYVIGRIKDRIKRRRSGSIVVVDAPLLIEANLLGIIDKLIVVTARRSVQLSRCMRKGKFKKEEILQRIRNQIPLYRKAQHADFIVDNNGTLTATKRQVATIWERL